MSTETTFPGVETKMSFDHAQDLLTSYKSLFTAIIRMASLTIGVEAPKVDPENLTECYEVAVRAFTGVMEQSKVVELNDKSVELEGQVSRLARQSKVLNEQNEILGQQVKAFGKRNAQQEKLIESNAKSIKHGSQLLEEAVERADWLDRERVKDLESYTKVKDALRVGKMRAEEERDEANEKGNAFAEKLKEVTACLRQATQLCKDLKRKNRGLSEALTEVEGKLEEANSRVVVAIKCGAEKVEKANQERDEANDRIKVRENARDERVGELKAVYKTLDDNNRDTHIEMEKLRRQVKSDKELLEIGKAHTMLNDFGILLTRLVETIESACGVAGEPLVDVERYDRALTLLDAIIALHSIEDRVRDIAKWGIERGILGQDGDGRRLLVQGLKCVSEVGELADSLAKGDCPKDDLGDIFVTLVMVANLGGLSIGECIEHAWGQIKDRKGAMVNGCFVKEGSSRDVERVMVWQGNASVDKDIWNWQDGKWESFDRIGKWDIFILRNGRENRPEKPPGMIKVCYTEDDLVDIEKLASDLGFEEESSVEEKGDDSIMQEMRQDSSADQAE